MSDEPEELAFPTGNPTHGGHSGMTLRDYFAGQALAALIAEAVSETDIINTPKAAYLLADAMLKARAE